MLLLTFDCRNNKYGFLCLWDDLAPQVEGGGGSGAAEDGDGIFLPKLDEFLEILRW